MFVVLRKIEISAVLADRERKEEKVWSGVHDRVSRLQSLCQHQKLDVQDQQESGLVDRTHVERVA